MKKPGLLSLLLLLTLAACGTEIPAGEQREAVRDEALHAVMSEDIDALLLQLEALVFDPHRTETELARLRQQRSAEIADAAWELRTATDILVRLPFARELPSDSRAEFRRLAGEMHDGASRLHDQARAGNSEAFTAITADIRRSCDSCHALYRN